MSNISKLKAMTARGLLLGAALATAGCTADGATGAGPKSKTLDVKGKEAQVAMLDDVFRGVYMAKPNDGVMGPTTGSATYNGAMVLGSDHRDPEYSATMAMTVDFAGGTADGSLWDFHDKAGSIAGGSVPLTGTYASGRAEFSGKGALDWGDESSTVDVDGYAYTYYGDKRWLWGNGTAKVVTDGKSTSLDAMIGGRNDAVPTP